MINLPKPSVLSAKGDSESKINYILNYLKMLVSALEVALRGADAKNDTVKSVTELSLKDGDLIVKYSDGSTKKLELGE